MLDQVKGSMKPSRTHNLWFKVHAQSCANILGVGNPEVTTLQGEYLQKTDFEELLKPSASQELKYTFYVCRLVLAVMNRHKYIAEDLVNNFLPEVTTDVPMNMFNVISTFYGALALCDIASLTEREERMLDTFAIDLEGWSRTNPSMFLSKHLLIKAELSRGNVNSIITLDAYEDAIKLSLDEGYINEAAIANERLGSYLETHSKKRSLLYLAEAVRLFTIWGAQPCVSRLLSKYPELGLPSYDVPRLGYASSSVATVTPTEPNRLSLTGSSKSLAALGQTASPLRWILSSLFRKDTSGEETDKSLMQNGGHEAEVDSTDEVELKTALQLCLDISEAIEVDSVIYKLVESVMKSSGADYCVFISIDEDGELYVDAVDRRDGVSMMRHVSIYGRLDAPLSVVYQVISTGMPISRQADPQQFDRIYGRDNYFQDRRRSQSVLCMPVQNQMKTIGALYLAHHSIANIFDQGRVELLGLFCAQAAVSLEKARLYHQMDLAKKAAEDATAEKASFLANMSHEIRTPFNALLSCSIFLLDTKLSDMQREYVEIIRSSAMLTLDIIDAILTFSKIEHGSIMLGSSLFSLRECVESAIQLVAEPAATKDLELVHLNRCGENDMICGDVTRVRQIIINLVGNAVKFTDKGYILVETRATKVSSDNRYEYIISVKDTGIGIPQSAKNKIFRAFSQVDGSARRVYGGSGLGLAISKKLAGMMGGNLSFKSSEDEGTTFWFDFVAMTKKPSLPNGPPGLPGTGLPMMEELQIYKGKRCLIIDYLEKSREALQMELELVGFEVDVWTEGGSTAVRQVECKASGYYAVVFMEGKLMSSDCMESIAMKKHSRTTQIVYMTTFGAPIPKDCEKKGLAAILMRPAHRKRLTQIIKSILGLSPSSSSTSSDVNEPSSFLSLTLASSSSSVAAVSTAGTTSTRTPKSFDASQHSIQTLATRHPLKILLAEDNPINTRVALQHLKRMGYNADHAKDGLEVLAFCDREVTAGRPMYDCVLMDIQMPHKDGLAATQDLYDRYRDREKRPVVVALTANVAGDDPQKCRAVGMESYIAKPILPENLAAVLMGIVPLKVVVPESKREREEDKKNEEETEKETEKEKGNQEDRMTMLEAVDRTSV